MGRRLAEAVSRIMQTGLFGSPALYMTSQVWEATISSVQSTFSFFIGEDGAGMARYF
jgi:hypothetical protein